MAQFRKAITTAQLLVVSAALIAGAAPEKPSRDHSFVIDSLRIPDEKAGPAGLEALVVRPSQTGTFPLVILSHGKSSTEAERKNQSPKILLAQAEEFAKRGWATAIVMRRGYGHSGGEFAENIQSCKYPDYLGPAKAGARDLRAAISHLAQQPYVDPKRILAVGHSAGGLVVIALAADPPPGLIGAINFAGAMGHIVDDDICQPGMLVSTFWILGKKSRIPTLWVYSENDHASPLPIARSCFEQFREAGGNATFVAAPAYGKDGHYLFSRAGIPLWTQYVDEFLAAHRDPQ
jgi:dienelactone hydrolase